MPLVTGHATKARRQILSQKVVDSETVSREERLMRQYFSPSDPYGPPRPTDSEHALNVRLLSKHATRGLQLGEHRPNSTVSKCGSLFSAGRDAVSQLRHVCPCARAWVLEVEGSLVFSSMPLAAKTHSQVSRHGPSRRWRA